MMESKKDILRGLPSVDELLRGAGLAGASGRCSRRVLADIVRDVLGAVRREVASGDCSVASAVEIESRVMERLERLTSPSMVRVVNASGTVLHTNIGRAVLSSRAVDAVDLAARSSVNLEFDLESGNRGERDSHVEELVTRLTGAEAACVVNNNAAALFLTLNTLALSKEAVVSRGELIEIGGSFRLPEIISASGCFLREVGTTNRTHESDYSAAATPATALFLKVHTSNYRVEGFTSEVDLAPLVAIARASDVLVVEDLGSGALTDLTRWGLPPEPVVAHSIRSGADIVTFSCDKLLGGPQAGIIAGSAELVERIRKNPLKRALRADKLTLAALEATLALYLDPDTLAETLPTLRYLTRPVEEIEKCAEEAARLLKDSLGEGFSVETAPEVSQPGAGSMPGSGLETRVVTITHKSASPGSVYRFFLSANPSILGRVKNDKFVLDMRCIDEPADVVPSGSFSE